jgi:hypothetical protein
MKALLPQEVTEVPLPFVIVCEGMGDVRLVCELVEHKGITNCNVGCPSKISVKAEGKDGIPSYLGGIRTLIGVGKAAIRGILVVADADDNIQASFSKMADALDNAGFPRPTEAFKLDGDPVRSGIFLIPGRGRTGTLEHLLWDASIKKNPKLEKCVRAFCRCTGGYINAAPPNKRAKMRMSAVVAAHCYDNPWASSALMWSSKNNPVPIDSPCFEELADFLAAFTA